MCCVKRTTWTAWKTVVSWLWTVESSARRSINAWDWTSFGRRILSYKNRQSANNSREFEWERNKGRDGELVLSFEFPFDLLFLLCLHCFPTSSLPTQARRYIDRNLAATLQKVYYYCLDSLIVIVALYSFSFSATLNGIIIGTVAISMC